MGQNNSNRGGGRSQQPIDNTFGYLQPQALELEKAMLGAQLIDNKAHDLISGFARKEIYYEPRHQMIQEAINTLAADGHPIDILTVTEQLARKGHLEEVGGPAYIAELSSKVTSSANIEYHTQIVAQKFLSRQLIALCTKIETKAYDETEDPADVLQEADSGILDLHNLFPDGDIRTLAETTREAQKEIMAAAANTEGVTGVPSFQNLDEVTAGYQNTDLVIIAARPAMGKTAFVLSTAKSICIDQHIPAAVFSLEMSGVQLTKRLISNVCEIPGNALLTGQLHRDGWERFDKNVQRLLDAPLYIDDTPSLTVGAFRAKAKRLVREKGVRIIFIDYLQLMHADGKRFGTRQEEVSEISRSLKTIAKELNIPVVALSQLNRAPEAREGAENKRPKLADLRESGAIEQDADVVIFLHRPEYYGILQDSGGNSLVGKAEILIAKHRKGATKTVNPLIMTFEGEYTRFSYEDKSLPDFGRSATPSNGGSGSGEGLPF